VCGLRDARTHALITDGLRYVVDGHSMYRPMVRIIQVCMHCVAVDKANNAGEVCFDVLGVSTGVGVSARPPAEKSHYAVLPVRRCYSQH